MLHTTRLGKSVASLNQWVSTSDFSVIDVDHFCAVNHRAAIFSTCLHLLDLKCSYSMPRRFHATTIKARQHFAHLAHGDIFNAFVSWYTGLDFGVAIFVFAVRCRRIDHAATIGVSNAGDMRPQACSSQRRYNYHSLSKVSRR